MTPANTEIKSWSAFLANHQTGEIPAKVLQRQVTLDSNEIVSLTLLVNGSATSIIITSSEGYGMALETFPPATIGQTNESTLIPQATIIPLNVTYITNSKYSHLMEIAATALNRFPDLSPQEFNNLSIANQALLIMAQLNQLA